MGDDTYDKHTVKKEIDVQNNQEMTYNWAEQSPQNMNSQIVEVQNSPTFKFSCTVEYYPRHQRDYQNVNQ